MRDEETADLAADMVKNLVLGNTEGAIAAAAQITNRECTEGLGYFVRLCDSMAEAMKHSPGTLQGLDAAKGLKCITNMHLLSQEQIVYILYALACQRAREINAAEAGRKGSR